VRVKCGAIKLFEVRVTHAVTCFGDLRRGGGGAAAAAAGRRRRRGCVGLAVFHRNGTTRFALFQAFVFKNGFFGCRTLFFETTAKT